MCDNETLGVISAWQGATVLLRYGVLLLDVELNTVRVCHYLLQKNKNNKYNYKQKMQLRPLSRSSKRDGVSTFIIPHFPWRARSILVPQTQDELTRRYFFVEIYAVLSWSSFCACSRECSIFTLLTSCAQKRRPP